MGHCLILHYSAANLSFLYRFNLEAGMYRATILAAMNKTNALAA